MSYQYLFGPVPSRRLGVSLGVDLVPFKVCSLNCVYCECGATTRLTVRRDEYVPLDAVTRELEDYFRQNPAPDYITFSGSGEPTLNSRIGELILFIKERFPRIPVAVLTNGTLFPDPGVRREVLPADVIMPSLDAATPSAFLKLNRPHHDLDVERHIRGFEELRKEYKGKIWLEVFILPGYNDDAENLAALKTAIQRTGADLIQINTLDRPGTIGGLRAAEGKTLEKIKKDWGLPQTEIIAPVSERKEKPSFRKDIENTILETVSRRPCTVADLSGILGLHINELNKYLDTLDADGKIEALEMKRGRFYQRKRDKSTGPAGS
ncbi:MAG: radical SAM protein [Candidatus Marinimicrobia bacterium]|nr:radical SAM protein [Candidatus Neomarinimicrobiota bacterium]